MVSTATILACVFTLLVSLIGPVIIFFVYSTKNPRQGVASSWIIGALGFLVPQVIIRVPILNILNGKPWFVAFSQNHLFLYVFSLAFTAGLFELAGRFAVAKWIDRKSLTYKRSFAAGLGHGGIEAILIIGTTYINNLVIIAMINSGTFETLLTQTAAVGADVSQLQMVRDSILTTSPLIFLLAGYERILTMIVQATMSMLVCWGVHRKQSGKWSLACLLMHTMLDSTAVISVLATDMGGNRLSQTTAYSIVYVILTLAAVLSVWILLKIRRNWMAEEKGGTL